MRVQDRRGRARVVSRVGLGGLGYGDLSGLLGDDEGGDGRRGEKRRGGERRGETRRDEIAIPALVMERIGGIVASII